MKLNNLNQDWLWVGRTYFFLGLSCFVLTPFVGENQWFFHGGFCLIGIFISTITFYGLKRCDFNTFLFDNRIVYLLSYTVYFLIGPSILAFGSESQIDQSMREYKVNASLVLMIDGLNAIGLGISLIISVIFKPIWLPNIVQVICINLKKNIQKKAIIYLSLVGLIAKIYIVSFDFQLIQNNEDDVISGIWRNLGNLLLMVVFLSALFSGKNQKKYHYYSFFITFFLVFIGITQFNKAEILLPIAALFGGITLRRNSYKFALYGFALIFFFFTLIGGPVLYSRINLYSINNYSLIDRFSLLLEGFSAASEGYESAEYSSWGRISYMNSQAAAVDFYDKGDGGDEIFLIPWLFVPRFLAPNKPIITDSGQKFYTKITGNVGSSTGQGIFINAYYNMGLLGLFLGSILCGLILAETSAISRVIVKSKNFLLYPIVFSGLFIAFRIDGFIVGDYLGVFVILTYTILVSYFLIKRFSKLFT